MPRRPVPGAPGTAGGGAGAAASAAAAIPPAPSRAPPRAAATSTSTSAAAAAAPSGVPPPPRRAPPPASPPASPPVVAPESAELAAATGKAEGVELWICLDFEWTCDEDTGQGRKVHSDEGELIEFSFVVYDAVAKKSVGQGQHYCKNERTPITDFCTNLTGISDETLKDAGSLKDALDAFNVLMDELKAESRVCCAVAHGSSDLELVLPSNCEAAGIPVPKVLRKYVDLREACQSHLKASGSAANGVRASSLRQICDALEVEMIGEEHCGLDDSWMVLLATQRLIERGADLRYVDLEAERSAFHLESCTERRLCFDGLPYFCVGTELRPWVEEHSGIQVTMRDLFIVLGLDGRPSGRAVADFGSPAAAREAFLRMAGGRRLTCGSLDTWPFEHPKERHIVVRPLRWQERGLPLVEGGAKQGPALALFPVDDKQLERIRKQGRPKQATEEAFGCEGTLRYFNTEKLFGFITYGDSEVFMHRSACEEGIRLREGMVLSFDVVADARSGKLRAANVKAASE